jgi:Concanavalin A-like lectin/glucanases superfamily
MYRRWDKSKPPIGPWALNRDCLQAQGLVAWYPLYGAGMDQASNSIWIPDAIGRVCPNVGLAANLVLGPTGEPAIKGSSAGTYAEALAVPLTSLPLSLYSWATYGTSVGNAQCLVSLCTDGANARVQLQTNSAGLAQAVTVDSAGTQNQASASIGLNVGQGYHLCATYLSTTSRVIYQDGLAVGSDTTSSVSNNWNRLLLGSRRNSGGVGLPWLGLQMDSGVYSLALSADQVAKLADRGTRFELYYPLRSAKWMSLASSGIVGAASITLDNIVVSAQGILPARGAAPLVLNPVTVAATGVLPVRGQVALQLADVVVAAQGSGGASGQAAVQLADVTVSATGTAPVKGQAAVGVSDVTVTAAGKLSLVAQAAVLLDPVTIAATGVFGTISAGEAAIMLDAITIVAAGQMKIAGTAPVQLADVVVNAAGQLALKGDGTVLLADVLVNATGHNAAGPPALTNEQMQQLHLWVFELHKIHGLQPGMPLAVSPASRVAGDISQTVSEAGGTVTVARV